MEAFCGVAGDRIVGLDRPPLLDDLAGRVEAGGRRHPVSLCPGPTGLLLTTLALRRSEDQDQTDGGASLVRLLTTLALQRSEESYRADGGRSIVRPQTTFAIQRSRGAAGSAR